jgi:hypothetical protein
VLVERFHIMYINLCNLRTDTLLPFFPYFSLILFLLVLMMYHGYSLAATA